MFRRQTGDAGDRADVASITPLNNAISVSPLDRPLNRLLPSLHPLRPRDQGSGIRDGIRDRDRDRDRGSRTRMNELTTTTDTRVRRPGRDGALDAALDRLVPGRLPERPDTPDGHVTAVRRLAPVDADLAPFPAALDPRLRQALESRGIRQLYTHQAQAIDHALAGRHAVVITPTASGKTLCYNAPVLHSILQDPSSRALYLFPDQGARPGPAGGAPGDVRDDRSGDR